MLFNFEKCKCLHAGHGNTGMNYEIGGTILLLYVKLYKGKALGVTINANMKVYTGNQTIEMIRRNIAYKENGLIVPLYNAIVNLN